MPKKRLKRVLIVGKTPESARELASEVKEYGFTLVKRNPQLVLSYGGDGTFLRAEQEYPGVLKSMIRKSKVCVKCHNFATGHVLDLISRGKYHVHEYAKLEVNIGGHKKRLTGVNDIVVRNTSPIRALRFHLWINNKKVARELIGDGIVVATPFGSTGYYDSITRKPFMKGIGLAFNNLVQPIKHRVLPPHSKIRMHTIRGDAYISADNNPHILTAKQGSTIVIRQSRQKARIVRVYGEK